MILKCHLGHWKWQCTARKTGYHLCPQFCRCCTLRMLESGKFQPWHDKRACTCGKYCDCISGG